MGASRKLRRNIWLRSGGSCYWCQTHVPLEKFTIDHVLPKSRGGTFRFDNGVASCRPCNAKKADMWPWEFVRSDKFRGSDAHREWLTYMWPVYRSVFHADQMTRRNPGRWPDPATLSERKEG